MTDLRTERTLLRPAQRQDVDQLHGIFSSPAAMKYWDTLPHTDPGQTAAFVERMMATPPDQGEDFVVESDGRIIGKAGFWQYPEIGFIFHPDHWGKGLATEVVAALLTHGFQTRNLPAVTAETDPHNDRSMRLLTKLGFVETHREANTIKIGDEWCDSVYFKLEASKAGTGSWG